MPRLAIHEIAGEGGASTGEVADWKPQPNVTHRVCIRLREHKDDAIVQLVRDGFDGAGGGRAVVFCRTRAYAEMVTGVARARVCARSRCTAISAAPRRERNLEKFTAGKADVLVATDAAARGIHVDDIDLVLQADPPDDPKATCIARRTAGWARWQRDHRDPAHPPEAHPRAVRGAGVRARVVRRLSARGEPVGEASRAATVLPPDRARRAGRNQVVGTPEPGPRAAAALA